MGQTQSGPGRLAPSSTIKRAGEDKKRAKSHDVLSSQKAVDDVVSVQDGGNGPSQTEMENKLLPKRRETLSPNHFLSSISGSGGGQYHSQTLQARRYSNTPSISSTRTTDSGHYPSAISSGNATHASQQQQQNQNRQVSLNLVGPSAGGQSLFNSNPISKSNQALHPSRTEFSSGTPKSPLTPPAIRPVPLPASFSAPSNKNYTHEAEVCFLIVISIFC